MPLPPAAMAALLLTSSNEIVNRLKFVIASAPIKQLLRMTQAQAISLNTYGTRWSVTTGSVISGAADSATAASAWRRIFYAQIGLDWRGDNPTVTIKFQTVPPLCLAPPMPTTFQERRYRGMEAGSFTDKNRLFRYRQIWRGLFLDGARA